MEARARKKLIKAEKRKEEEAKRLAEEEEKKRLLEEEMDDATTLSQPLDEDIDGDNKPDKTMMEEEGEKLDV